MADRRVALPYRRVQTAFVPWLVALVGVVALGAVFLATDELRGSNLVIMLALAASVAVGLAFARLTVTVDQTAVSAVFGFGWPRREIPIGDIVAAHTVRNRWWHGWGARSIPGGKMYNVWGFDAVELELRSGTVFRVGTEEPEALVGAVRSAQAA